MSKTLKIVGLRSSLEGNSKSRAALRTATDGVASAGVAPQLLGIRHLVAYRSHSSPQWRP